MKTQIIQPEDLSLGVDLLLQGQTVIFPTETVYGLGARFDQDKAVAKIFKAKNRPADNPLIVHIAKAQQVFDIAKHVPEKALKAMEIFWPGPLTLVLDKQDHVSDLVTAGLDTVAIRMPSHPVASRLLEAVGIPIAAPSANLSQRPSPTRFSHLEEMIGRVAGIIEGDTSEIGLESTVVRFSGDKVIVLRPGHISKEALEEHLGKVIRVHQDDELAKHSPGMRHRHYHPKAEVIILKGSREAVDRFRKRHPKSAFILKPREDASTLGIDKIDGLRAQLHPIDENAFCLYTHEDKDYGGANLFHYFHVLDKLFYDIIYIENLPTRPESAAVRDRIFRAAGGRIVELEEE